MEYSKKRPLPWFEDKIIDHDPQPNQNYRFFDDFNLI